MRILLRFPALMILTITVAQGQDARLSPGAQEKIDAAIKRLIQQKGVPGLSVAIAQRNQLVYEKGLGKAALKRLKQAIRHEVQNKQLPAFSMALVDGRTTVWADGFGYRDDKRSAPADGHTV